MDVFTKQKRSQVMSRIRSSGNKATELRLISILKKNRLSGWRRQQPVFGKPDFVFPRAKLAVFVDGCFWHGCPKCYREPKSKKAFWREKVFRNRKRDRRVNKSLRETGWRVVRIWECQLEKTPDKCIHRIVDALGK